MSHVPDPFEAELSALRPREVSPELRRGVAERLAVSVPAKQDRSRLLRYVLAVGLAAGLLGAVVLWRGSGQCVDRQTFVVRPQPAPRVEVEDADLHDADIQDAGPTLLAYQRALARSPKELEALLNRQALAAPDVNPALGQIRAFTRSDADLRALLGDD